MTSSPTASDRSTDDNLHRLARLPNHWSFVFSAFSCNRRDEHEDTWCGPRQSSNFRKPCLVGDPAMLLPCTSDSSRLWSARSKYGTKTSLLSDFVQTGLLQLTFCMASSSKCFQNCSACRTTSPELFSRPTDDVMPDLCIINYTYFQSRVEFVPNSRWWPSRFDPQLRHLIYS